MTRLSQSDLYAVFGFIEEIGGISEPAVFPDRLLSGLAKLIPSDTICYDEMSAEGATLIRSHLPSDAVPDDAEAACNQFVHQHPMVSHYFLTRDTRALTASDFISRRDFKRLELYQDCYHRIGWEYQLAVLIPSPRSRIRSVMFNRQARDYSTRDRMVAELIRPHVGQVYLDAQSRSLMRGVVTGLQRAVDDQDKGVVLIGPDSLVIMSTTQASDWWRLYFGRPAQEGASLPGVLHEFVHHQRQARHGEAELALPNRELVVKRDDGCLVVRFVPAGEEGGSDAQVLQEQNGIADDHLTRRERDVLRLAAEGLTNREIADALFVSHRTVQKHLEHLFGKLGVHTRMAAARALSARRGLDS